MLDCMQERLSSLEELVYGVYMWQIPYFKSGNIRQIDNFLNKTAQAGIFQNFGGVGDDNCYTIGTKDKNALLHPGTSSLFISITFATPFVLVKSGISLVLKLKIRKIVFKKVCLLYHRPLSLGSMFQPATSTVSMCTILVSCHASADRSENTNLSTWWKLI